MHADLITSSAVLEWRGLADTFVFREQPLCLWSTLDQMPLPMTPIRVEEVFFLDVVFASTILKHNFSYDFAFDVSDTA